MKTSIRIARGRSRLKSIRNAGLLALAGLSLVVGASLGLTQTIPNNAQNTANVPPPMFASWFTLGFPTVNGEVDPADSLNFSNIPNVDFYRWSWQMFLWLLSPAPSTYGGGGFVFTSPVFFDVSPPDPSGIRHFSAVRSGGERTLTRHVPGKPFQAGIRVAPFGPHNLPVIITKNRKVYEIVPTRLSSNGKPLLKDGSGKVAEVGRITVDSKKNPIFVDSRGKTISNPKAIFDSENAGNSGIGKADPDSLVQRFTDGKGASSFFGPRGRIMEVEVEQAGNGVLMSQAKSLVYYASMVNDVYAYFLTGTKNGGIAPTPANSVVVGPNTIFRFPTDLVGLNEVITFGAANGVSFPDAIALAVELKTSWVDASTVPNPKDFVIRTGVVPIYDTTDPDHWKQIGQTKMDLAMVGMHVVGSTKGHPEMIWATFEHFGNAPNAKYQYVNNLGMTVTGPFDPGPWMFCSSPGGPSFNVQHMSYNTVTGGIDSIFPFNISPSDTKRVNPWGMPPGSAASNTQIISIDNSVLTQLIPGDIRANYFMTGSTWTIGGQPPNGFNQVGTNLSANTTMETYMQGINCFGCHQSTSGSPVTTTDISHIFGPLKPLF